MSKYRNVKTNGYDSKREANYAAQLEMMKCADDIHYRVAEIERQVRYTLVPAQRGLDGKLAERAVIYIADFRVSYADGRVEVVDVKGMKTREYILKRKLMRHVHGIEIREV